jgi:hypothetical protein
MMDTNGFDKSVMSTIARKACKAQHFTPRYWVPLNMGAPESALEDNEPVMRCWNSRRCIILTAGDLRYASQYL